MTYKTMSEQARYQGNFTSKDIENNLFLKISLKAGPHCSLVKLRWAAQVPRCCQCRPTRCALYLQCSCVLHYIWNIFCNVDKYNFQFGQIHVEMMRWASQVSAYKVCSCLMRLQLDRKVVAVTCVESRCCTSTSRCTDALVASLVVGAQQKQFLNCFLAVKNMFVKLSYGKMAPTLIQGFKNAPRPNPPTSVLGLCLNIRVKWSL